MTESHQDDGKIPALPLSEQNRLQGPSFFSHHASYSSPPLTALDASRKFTSRTPPLTLTLHTPACLGPPSKVQMTHTNPRPSPPKKNIFLNPHPLFKFP